MLAVRCTHCLRTNPNSTASRTQIMKAKSVLQIIAAASLALMVGCATSHQPIRSEAAESVVAENFGPVGSIAVFLVTENQQERAEWEDSFSASMNEAGISTKTTYH